MIVAEYLLLTRPLSFSYAGEISDMDFIIYRGNKEWTQFPCSYQQEHRLIHTYCPLPLLVSKLHSVTDTQTTVVAL